MGPTVMIVLALALFALLKAITLVDFLRRAKIEVPWYERALWFAAWPGLNPDHFFSRIPEGHLRPAIQEWSFAAAKTILGAGLLAAAARIIPANQMLGGWIGMLGVIFCMHFGGFHLLALAWRSAGRDVRPIMNAPILAGSLSEFWSQRWNLAFRDFTSAFVLRPLCRVCDVRLAGLICFAFSGLIHDLVISIPAGGGYGLPTLYFLLQGLGVTLERSRLGARFGLRRGWRGRAYAIAFTALPAYWLFHPPFVTNVIVPLFG